jgi:hypothetical protein
LNRRPLDPQEVGLGVFTGKDGSKGDAPGVMTCGLFSRVHTVWSQTGPKPCRGRASQRPPGVNYRRNGPPGSSAKLGQQCLAASAPAPHPLAKAAPATTSAGSRCRHLAELLIRRQIELLPLGFVNGGGFGRAKRPYPLIRVTAVQFGVYGDSQCVIWRRGVRWLRGAPSRLRAG